MLKLAVCDDEKVFRSDLKRILGMELDLCGIDYHITEFASGEELIAGLEKTDCQILFLDIEMKGMDGVAAARKLREMKRQMEIIFVTSYADFVFQGYRSARTELYIEALRTGADRGGPSHGAGSAGYRGGKVLCD